jgi:thymidylate synthase
MTLHITKNTIGEAHEKVVSFIRKQGEIIQTEDKEWTKEILDIKIKISNPFDEPRISECCFMGKMGFDEYANNIVYGYKKHVNFIYDYHSRLFDWGGGTQDDGVITFTGKTPQDIHYAKKITDQIEYIINKLKEDITSRRALATTWIPPIDENRDDVPCLQLVQFLIRNNKLEMFVIFRSEDMLSGFGQNAYGLTMLQKYVASKLSVQIGSYHHYVISGHIYHIRDSHELDMFPDTD